MTALAPVHPGLSLPWGRPPDWRTLAAPHARTVVTAGAWLYLYFVLWLVVYTVLAVVAFGWTPVLITSGSMSPGIKPGDLVLLGEVDGEIGRGTVITFTSQARGGELVTHRVAAVLPEGYRTRGDANEVDDSTIVAQSDVLGAGRLLIPTIGRPVVWLRDSRVLQLVGWALGSAAAVGLVLHQRRVLRTEQQEADERSMQEGATPSAAPATQQLEDGPWQRLLGAWAQASARPGVALFVVGILVGVGVAVGPSALGRLLPAGQPVAGPPVAGPPVAGPPVAGPPVAGPPVPAVAGPPAPAVAGSPVSRVLVGPPTAPCPAAADGGRLPVGCRG